MDFSSKYVAAADGAEVFLTTENVTATRIKVNIAPAQKPIRRYNSHPPIACLQHLLHTVGHNLPLLPSAGIGADQTQLFQ